MGCILTDDNINQCLVLSSVDGDLSTTVVLDDRGLAYGHGLFESMRLWSGKIPLQTEHLARIYRDARRLNISVETSTVARYLERFIAHLNCLGITAGVIKLMITAGSGARGYRIPEAMAPRYILRFSELPTDLLRSGEGGVGLYQCDYRLPQNTALAGVKHLNRLDQILARSEWHDEYQDGLMLDQKNYVIETTSANIFIRHANEWLTPRLTGAGIDGILRSLIINQLAPAKGLNVREGALTMADISACSEWFLCNSVRGIVPIVNLMGRQQWSIGDNTQKLCQALTERYLCYA